MNEPDFQPYFDFPEPNKDVFLAQDSVILQYGGTSYVGTGTVYLRLLPRARIEVRIKFDADVSINMDDPPDSVLLQNRKLNISGFVTQVTMPTDKGTTLTWTPKKEPIVALGNDSTSINSVIFHLFNFKQITGTRRRAETVGETTHAIEHVDLPSKDWRVELRSLPSTESTIKQLEEQGGFGLTHIGRFEKVGRVPFSGKEAEELLSALYHFFSFAKGGWCGPICPVGFDASNSRVWEMWSSPREPWYTPLSWFDPHNSDQLVTLFPGFMNRWADDYWRVALHEVIYWYLNANHRSRGIEAGIILTQAAIERLSYELSVKDRRLLTVKGFKDIRASDKFRLLFSTLNIPLGIPTETPELQRLASNSQMNWFDTPHVLTEIRNSLVHPEHKHHRQFDNACYEAWNIGLWYMEMSILAVCGYSGTYGNRLKQRWVGQIENVPWE